MLERQFTINNISQIILNKKQERIEEVVEKIIVHKNWFEWKLVFLNEPINLEVKGKKQDFFIVEHEKQKLSHFSLKNHTFKRPYQIS